MKRRTSQRNVTPQLQSVRKSSRRCSVKKTASVQHIKLNEEDEEQLSNSLEEQNLKNDTNGVTVISTENDNNNNEHFQCGTCSKNFPTLDLLSFHIHTCASFFQCHMCNDSFSTNDLLSTHLTKEHSNSIKPFKCGLCGAGFFENAFLLKHLADNHETLPYLYKCNACLIPFQDISKLCSHVTKNHLACEKYKCGLCGKSFSLGAKLTHHIQQKHRAKSHQLSKCSVCFYMVPSSAIDEHIKKHKSESNENENGAKDEEKKTESNNADTKKTTQKTKTTKRCKVTHENEFSKVEAEQANGKDILRTAENKDDDIDESESDSEATNVEQELIDDDMSKKEDETRKKKKILKYNSEGGRQIPLIKDKNKLIKTYSKIDPETKHVVYDCDICGLRLQEQSSFLGHRDDHFFDDKFCISCKQCSQVFYSFENLSEHVEKGECVGYQCQTCGKSFALEPLLLTHRFRDHMDMTKTNGLLACPICEKRFENRTAYLRHASSHSEDKCIECKICRHAFTTQETLFGHLRTRHSLIPSTRQQYKVFCEICNTVFMKVEALIKHKAVVHDIHENPCKPVVKCEKSKLHPEPEVELSSKQKQVKRTGHWRSEEDDKKRRTCHICNRVFRRFKDVRRHIGTHTKPYLCSHCGKSFPYRYSLDAHIKAYHSADNPHRCETCDKSFSCHRSLLVHKRIHTGEKPHQCPVCQKRFRQIANLSMHVKLHNTDKPIKCELCDYRCRHQGYLKRHMSTHSTEKKYHCPICNKGFTEKPNLNHHIKRHSKIKNHVCPVCGHRFGERYYLNNHMRVHTKEKPFVCPVCSRAFTMRPNMVAHIKKTHPSYNYQPIKRSRQRTNSVNTINKLPDISVSKQMEAETCPIGSVVNDNQSSVPIISPPSYSFLTSSAQQPLSLPPPNLSSHLPMSSSNIPQYHHLSVSSVSSEETRAKMESHLFTNPQNLLPHHPSLQKELQSPAPAAIAMMREDISQQTENGREHAVVMDQNIFQERHQNFINLTERFASTPFDPQRDIPTQSFSSTVPMSNHEYMYTYPSLPPESSFLQGFFPLTNHHNQNTQQPK